MTMLLILIIKAISLFINLQLLSFGTTSAVGNFNDCGTVWPSLTPSLIIDAERGQYPWIALTKAQFASDSSTKRCSASLINDQWLITAAHCVIRNRELAVVTVRLGKFDLDASEPNDEPWLVTPIVHPFYSEQDRSNDVALLQLANPLQNFTKTIRPICLPQGLLCQENVTSLTRTCKFPLVDGWGTSYQDPIKRSTMLETLPSNDCASRLLDMDVDSHQPGLKVCAKGKNASNTCLAGYGGTLMCLNNARYYAIGVMTKLGQTPCGHPAAANVSFYTRVCPVLPWIRQTTGIAPISYETTTTTTTTTKPCTVPPVIANGKLMLNYSLSTNTNSTAVVVPVARTRVPLNTIVTILCDSGFRMPAGSWDTSICISTGMWFPEVTTTCENICGDMPVIRNGYINATSGQVVCGDEFLVDGASTITCNRNTSQWSKPGSCILPAERIADMMRAVDNDDIPKLRQMLQAIPRELLVNISFWQRLEGNKNADTPLHRAARFNYLDLVKMVSSQVPELILLQNLNGQTAIHEAVANNSIQVVEFFLAAKPDLLELREGYANRTLIYLAAEHGNLYLVQMLTDHGANVYARANSRRHEAMAIHEAAYNGYLPVVQFFLMKFPDMWNSSIVMGGQVPLINIAAAGNVTVLMYLFTFKPSLANERDYSGAKPIHAAASSGNVECVEFLLKWQPSLIEAKDFSGARPIHVAALNGRVEVVNIFLRRGVDVGVRQDSLGLTPLHYAAINGSLELVQMLVVDHGANLTDKTNAQDGQETPIHEAAMMGHVKVVDFMLFKEPSLIEAKDGAGNFAIHSAAWMGRVRVVELLLNRSVDVNLRQASLGETPLHLAAYNGSLELVKLLFRKGADIKAKANSEALQEMPIHTAATRGFAEIVSFFLRADSSVIDEKDSQGAYVIHRSGSVNVTDVLLRRDVSVDLPDDQRGRTPLHFAAQKGNLELVKFLIKKGANITARSNLKDGQLLPIHLAAISGQLPVVKYLLSLQPRLVDARDQNGNSLLDGAVANGQVEVVDFLLNKQFSPIDDLRNLNSGRTLLHSAAFQGQLGVVKLLIQRGANISARSSANDRESLPIHLAAKNGQVDVVKYLLTVDPSQINATDDDGYLPIHCAASSGQVSVVDLLLKLGQDIEVRDENLGFTCLHLASSGGFLPLVKMLVAKGADITATANKYGSTEPMPIHLAAGIGQLAVIDFLVTQNASLLTVNDAVGKEPIHWAAFSGNIQVVDYFLQHNVSSNVRDGQGRTILHQAASAGKIDLVKHLLVVNPNLTRAQDNDESTPLHLAVFFNQKSVVFALLSQQQIDINKPAAISGRTLLHIAAGQGNFDLVKYFVENGAQLTAVTSEVDGRNLPLHSAAYFGHLPVVDYFVSLRPDLVNVTNTRGNLAVHSASLNGHLAVVNYLLHSGVSVDVRGENGETCLHLAAGGGYLELVKLLISGGANIATKSDLESMPIHKAAASGSVPLIRLFLDEVPGMLDARDKTGQLPVHYAASRGQTAAVDFFLRQGDAVDVRATLTNRTSLHYAAYGGYLDLVKMLVSKGADLSAKSNTSDGELLPIHLAALANKAVVVDYFLAKNESLKTEVDSNGYGVIHYAANGTGQVAVVDLLLSHGVDIEQRDFKTGRTPLLVAAAANNQTELVSYLLRKGANIMATSNSDDLRRMPIHLAARYGHFATVSLLLANRANLTEAKDSDGNRPIHLAVQSGNLALVKFLLNFAAVDDIDVRQDGYNKTPLHVAAENGFLDIVKILVLNGSDIEARTSSDGDEMLPIHLAAAGGHIDVIDYFIALQPNLTNVTDSQGVRPIDEAIFTGQLAAAEYFLNNSLVPVNGRATEIGWTLLHEASFTGHLDIVKMLVAHGADMFAKTDYDDSERLPVHLAAWKGYLPVVQYFIGIHPGLRYAEDRDGRKPLQWAQVSYNGKMRTTQSAMVRWLTNGNSDSEPKFSTK